MQVEPAPLQGVLLLRPTRHEDQRGFFSEVFRHDLLQTLGSDLLWVQENHSCSRAAGVVRGLHFQTPPFAQAKLIRVIRGAIWDVVVDLRRGSPSYGKHLAVELSAENWLQLAIPSGFAHGFCSLQANTEVLYKVSAPHAPHCEAGLAWDDPELAIPWPIDRAQAILSARDQCWPGFESFETPFD